MRFANIQKNQFFFPNNTKFGVWAEKMKCERTSKINQSGLTKECKDKDTKILKIKK